ncbi:MAG: DUF3842 family protein [Anaerovoracaceae bacterium]
MTILIIDAQGGGLGRQLVLAIKQNIPDARIFAVGTSVATTAMLKAGADGATGENAVAVGCRRADIITGPVGIVISDSLSGEITPRIALSVSRSSATRILIPFNNCDNIIAGVADLSMGKLIQNAISEIKKLTESRNK